jgi:hypothetical protein
MQNMNKNMNSLKAQLREAIHAVAYRSIDRVLQHHDKQWQIEAPAPNAPDGAQEACHEQTNAAIDNSGFNNHLV